jgi:hypothetical protein
MGNQSSVEKTIGLKIVNKKTVGAGWNAHIDQKAELLVVIVFFCKIFGLTCLCLQPMP